MSELTFLAQFWEGFHVTNIETNPTSIHFTLEPNSSGRCRCGQLTNSIHDSSWRNIQDATMLGRKVSLAVKTRRIVCPNCGVVTESIRWLEPFARITKRLQSYVEGLLPILPIKHISEVTGLHWHTIKQIDKARLAQQVKAPNWSRVKRLVMDEFALFKGHRYATVIADADTYQVLWIGVGRARQHIRPFFESLGEHCQQIEAVAMDMNTAFDLEVKQHCPQARIVYDLFHVVAKYGREVVDRVRVDQANQLKHDKQARRWVKRSRWVLLKNRDNLNTHQQGYLDELLSMNRDLMVVYLLGEQLKELWYCEDEEQAKNLWQCWWQQVIESGIKPLIAFAQRLKPYLHGITSSAIYRMNTCTLEGMNNKIKLIKRMAYGYRDIEYFFLKIKAAFPGKPR
ncbi:ISL3 family transposase [Thalassotalea euphylliae]|uniref:ISL3 family transposase n=1 Tax=Thalassotalea euphylliae TaxID=1655234 RepID=A0A3E0TU63_9GAMM|nr:ISL3 family transposase [Thalassotalea euphylliae]REL25308.1 ISL3 family transposase [Thalassotalea euphylliae]REL27056.1 ISL3 family transposase [Thalassotalea euphylliae]REL27081.1 ISL3 family transposase [Thalassotalea euphylliae]REL28098.1 ISL3 family transposase [Thalassotalea euphylliae]